MDLGDCKMLLRHAEWADSLVWQAVSASGTEDAELRGKLHHMHLVQWAYLSIWRGEEVAFRDLSTFPTTRAIQSWAREYYRELWLHLPHVPEEGLAAEVRFPWADDLVRRFGKAQPATWAESVMQIALHGTYHRGQIARRLRELGSEPPLSDFIAWVWQGRPAADWGGAEADGVPTG